MKSWTRLEPAGWRSVKLKASMLQNVAVICEGIQARCNQRRFFVHGYRSVQGFSTSSSKQHVRRTSRRGHKSRISQSSAQNKSKERRPKQELDTHYSKNPFCDSRYFGGRYESESANILSEAIRNGLFEPETASASKLSANILAAVQYGMRDKSLLDRYAVRATTLLGLMRAKDLSKVMHSFAKAGHVSIPWLQAVEKILPGKLNESTPQALSMIINALGTLNYQSKTLETRFIQDIPHRLHLFGPIDFLLLLSGLRKLNIKDSALYHDISQEISKKDVVYFSQDQIAGMSMSFSQVGHGTNAMWCKLSESMIHHHQREEVKTFGFFPWTKFVLGVTNFYKGTQHLEFPDEVQRMLTVFSEEIAKDSKRFVDSLPKTGVSYVFRCLARAEILTTDLVELLTPRILDEWCQGSPSSGPLNKLIDGLAYVPKHGWNTVQCSQQLLLELRPHVIKALPTMPSWILCRLIVGSARSEIHELEYVKKILQQLISRAPELTSKQLTFVLCGLNKWGIRSTIVTRRLIQAALVKLPLFTPSELAYFLKASSAMGVTCPILLDAAAKYTGSQMKYLQKAEVEQLCRGFQNHWRLLNQDANNHQGVSQEIQTLLKRLLLQKNRENRSSCRTICLDNAIVAASHGNLLPSPGENAKMINKLSGAFGAAAPALVYHPTSEAAKRRMKKQGTTIISKRQHFSSFAGVSPPTLEELDALWKAHLKKRGGAATIPVGMAKESTGVNGLDQSFADCETPLILRGRALKVMAYRSGEVQEGTIEPWVAISNTTQLRQLPTRAIENELWTLRRRRRWKRFFRLPAKE